MCIFLQCICTESLVNCERTDIEEQFSLVQSVPSFAFKKRGHQPGPPFVSGQSIEFALHLQNNENCGHSIGVLAAQSSRCPGDGVRLWSTVELPGFGFRTWMEFLVPLNLLEQNFCLYQVVTTSTEPNERETSFLLAAQILWCFFISQTFLNTQQLIWNSVSVRSSSTNEDTNTWIHLVFWY